MDQGGGSTDGSAGEDGAAVDLRTGLIGALAFAGDLSMGQPIDHSPRVALLARRLCEVIGIDADGMRICEAAALMRWSGCTANAGEFATLFGDDVGGRAALIEARDPFVASVPPADGQVAPLVRPLSAMHCETVAYLADRLGMDRRVGRAAQDFFELWDGSGLPAGKRGEEIDLHAQIVALAGDFEVWSRVRGAVGAMALLDGASGTRHDPELSRIVRGEWQGWLADLAALDPWTECALALPQAPAPFDLDACARLLGDYVELKIPEHVGRTARIAGLARSVARYMGLPDAQADLLWRAGHLHGLGRAGVPNGVLARSAAPGEADREVLALVPHWTRRALSRLPHLDREGDLASASFERLDGSGTHRGLRGTQIDTPARILQAAVTAFGTGPQDARPPAARLSDGVARGWLDPQVAEVAAHILRNPRAEPVRAQDRSDLTERERDVLGRLIHGRTNKQIAIDLGVSPKTVGTHLENVYRKLGVSNRATATLRAIELQLV